MKNRKKIKKNDQKMEQKEIKVQFRLISISEVKSMIATADKLSSLSSASEVQISFTNQVYPEVKDNKISLVFGAKYTFKESVLMDIAYRFSFAVKDLDKYVTLNLDGSASITTIMPILINIAMGGMRGIVAVKSAGTVLEKYPVPVIDERSLLQALSKKNA